MASNQELQIIAGILRRDSIMSTTSAGSGHPTSCLSCAEIMACLFFNELKLDAKNSNNLDNDEFILSKGHASPILYSSLFHRGLIKENILSLRNLNSNLEGHPMPKSIPWVKVATGSLGQGLSVGAGMALASGIQGRSSRTYVLLGDSELSEGSNYEAIEFAANYNLGNLVAIVDVNGLGQTGQTMQGHNTSNYKKRFSAFGWNVIEINGHSIKEILYSLKSSKNNTKPTIILAKTIKGKGVSFLENKDGWHGKALSDEEASKALEEIQNSSFPNINYEKPTPGIFRKKKFSFVDTYYEKGEAVSTREAFGRAVSSLAESDNYVYGIDAETGNSNFLSKISEISEERLVQTGIAEQNLVGLALGMSKKGLSIFGSTFAAFLSRAHDQIRMSSLSDPNFTLVGSHAGVSIGQDGASQMGLEDISIFRSLPDSIVLYPSDAVSTEKIVRLCHTTKGLKYIRTTRGKTPVIYKSGEKFPLGEFKVLKESKEDQVVLIGSGITLHESLKAQELLEKEGKKSAVIDLYCIKPLNGKKLISFIKKHGNKVIITEDHRKEGGIGESLLSEIQNTGIEIKHLYVKGIPHSGKPEELLKKHKIDSESIESVALDLIF